MDKLTEAFQRLVEYRPDLFGYNLYGEALLRGERYGPLKAKKLGYPHLFTQDRCDEVAAEIGYVLRTEIEAPIPEHPHWIVTGLYAQQDSEFALAAYYECDGVTDLPEMKRGIAKQTLTASIHDLCDNLPVPKSNSNTGVK